MGNDYGRPCCHRYGPSSGCMECGAEMFHNEGCSQLERTREQLKASPLLAKLMWFQEGKKKDKKRGRRDA